MGCENNKSMKCPCTYSCDKHGKCCACVAYHQRDGEFPACFFSAKMERPTTAAFKRLPKTEKGVDIQCAV